MFNVAQLTIREYNEYLKWLDPGDAEIWQLWNVENLAEDAGQILITRFETIPETTQQQSVLSRLGLVRCATDVVSLDCREGTADP